MSARFWAIAGLAVMAVTVAAEVAAQPSGPGQGWMGELDHSSRQLLQLADAIPAEKWGWRPAPGVRSVSEVYMHVAIGNYLLLEQAGVKASVDLAALGKEPETSLTGKPEVVKFLKDSFDAVRTAYPAADKQKATKFFGMRDTTVDGIFLRILVHNHEHMGQAIAYARTMGVVPPWSRAGEQ